MKDIMAYSIQQFVQLLINYWYLILKVAYTFPTWLWFFTCVCKIFINVSVNEPWKGKFCYKSSPFKSCALHHIFHRLSYKVNVLQSCHFRVVQNLQPQNLLPIIRLVIDEYIHIPVFIYESYDTSQQVCQFLFKALQGCPPEM